MWYHYIMDTTSMETRIKIMLPLLDERQRRIFLAVEAQTFGRGGISRVCEISGVAPFTIRQGIAEINGEEPPKASERLRAPGGGRKKLEESMPNLDEHILQIVDAVPIHDLRQTPDDLLAGPGVGQIGRAHLHRRRIGLL